MNKSLSFIIPCFNSEDTISLCLNSIINQDGFSDDVEIILIDDGSNDGTKRIIEEDFKIDNLKMITNKHNRGLAFSRNSGGRLSGGKVLAFLDSDMILKNDWIDRALNIFNNENIVAVMGQYVAPPNKKQNTLDKYLYSNLRGAKKLYNNGDIIDYKYFLCSNTLMRRNVFNDVGGFDDNITKYGGEDTELAIRLNKMFSNQLYYFPELISYHYGQKTLGAFCQNMKIYGEFNLPLIFNKHRDCRDHLGFKWFTAFRGKLIFNKFIMLIINQILKLKTIPLLLRYKIVYNTVVGYRNYLKK